MTAHPLSRAFLLILFPLSGILSAQNVHFAFQFGPSAPLSDLKAVVVNPGMSVGFLVHWDLRHGHVLRPRLDYSDWNRDGLSRYGEANAISMGADYLFHVSGKAKGFYLLGGVGYQRSTFPGHRQPFATYYNGEGTYFGSAGAPSFAAGLGWQFSGLFGMELRYTTTKPSIEGQKVAFDAANLGFTFTWGQ